MPPTWRTLSMELRTRGDPDLKRDLVKAIRREGEPAVRAVQAAWRSVRVSGSSRGGRGRPDRSTGLRERVAKATRVQVSQSGVRIVVDGRKVDPQYGRGLAWYLNASGKPWRHPVFGRRENPQDWQEQRGQSVFYETLRNHEPRFRRAVGEAMETVARNF